MSTQDILSAHGVETTPRRAAVIGVLEGLEHAPTAPELLELVRHTVRLDKVTLYRCLDLLVASGIVSRHSGGDGLLRYCLAREDAATPHAHFYCTLCRRMSCLPPAITPLPAPPRLAQGMTPQRVELRVDGICEHCGATHGVALEAPAPDLIPRGRHT